MSTQDNNEPENETPIETAVESTEVSDTTREPKSNDYTMGMLCHLLSFVGLIGVPFGNVIGPLVLWLVKKDEDAFVDETGKEVLNFQISMTIYVAVCFALTLVVVGLFLLPVVIVLNVVYTIIAAIKANEGQCYKYPFTIRFIK